MSQLHIESIGPAADPERSQWFTPPEVAAELVGLAGPILGDYTRTAYPARVLEPSAGCGNLVRQIQARAPGAQITAVEIDPRWARELRVLGECTVVEGDYLAQPAPERLYDLAVMNPPYNGGEEAAHLEKVMWESAAVCALLPSRSMHGLNRHRRIWSQIGQGWYLRKLVHCIRRPCFAATGGVDEIVLVYLSRMAGHTVVRWW